MQAQHMQPGDRFFWDGKWHTVTKPTTLEENADGGDSIFAKVTAKADGSDVEFAAAFYKEDTLPQPPVPEDG